MSKNKIVLKPSFFFKFNKKLESSIKKYIKYRPKQEISGGLIGDIKGGRKNQILFNIQMFLPFPNLAENKQFYAEPPSIWFDILEEWRLFYCNTLKFIGFLHTHPEGSSKLSEQDNNFAMFLQKKYGTILFIIISENKTLRSYVFNNSGFRLINGISNYKVILK